MFLLSIEHCLSDIWGPRYSPVKKVFFLWVIRNLINKMVITMLSKNRQTHYIGFLRDESGGLPSPFSLQGRVEDCCQAQLQLQLQPS